MIQVSVLLLKRQALAFALGIGIGGNSCAALYDPLTLPAQQPGSHLDLSVHDSARQRDIPIRIYLPAGTSAAPVILFSHGLGGSRAGSVFLGEHWAGRGYVAVFLQHPGSDDSLWRNQSTGHRLETLKQAGSLDNFLFRVRDVPAVLDQLATWNANNGNPLAGRLDLTKVGMSGHSFGAVTTQAVSGEAFRFEGGNFTDSRIKAAIAFSPSAPRGVSASRAFGSVKIPWMLMTGTKDRAPIGRADVASRLAVYPALQGAAQYELVLNNAEHSVFTDRPLPGDREPRNPNHYRVILALSTAFWDAYLRGDPDALAWLNGSGARSVMEAADRWQFSAHVAK